MDTNNKNGHLHDNFVNTHKLNERINTTRTTKPVSMFSNLEASGTPQTAETNQPSATTPRMFFQSEQVNGLRWIQQQPGPPRWIKNEHFHQERNRMNQQMMMNHTSEIENDPTQEFPSASFQPDRKTAEIQSTIRSLPTFNVDEEAPSSNDDAMSKNRSTKGTLIFYENQDIKQVKFNTYPMASIDFKNMSEEENNDTTTKDNNSTNVSSMIRSSVNTLISYLPNFMLDNESDNKKPTKPTKPVKSEDVYFRQLTRLDDTRFLPINLLRTIAWLMAQETNIEIARETSKPSRLYRDVELLNHTDDICEIMVSISNLIGVTVYNWRQTYDDLRSKLYDLFKYPAVICSTNTVLSKELSAVFFYIKLVKSAPKPANI